MGRRYPEGASESSILSAHERLAESGIDLPGVLPSAGDYLPAVRTGAAILSDTGPRRPDGGFVTGTVGDTVYIDAAISQSV